MSAVANYRITSSEDLNEAVVCKIQSYMRIHVPKNVTDIVRHVVYTNLLKTNLQPQIAVNATNLIIDGWISNCHNRTIHEEDVLLNLCHWMESYITFNNPKI